MTESETTDSEQAATSDEHTDSSPASPFDAQTPTNPAPEDVEVPEMNHGPSYAEIKEELEKSPDKYEYGTDEDQDYIDRDSIDFDPKDGLFAGTAVDGTSDIPDPDEAVAAANSGEPSSPQAESGDSAQANSGDSAQAESGGSSDEDSGGSSDDDRPMPGPGDTRT